MSRRLSVCQRCETVVEKVKPQDLTRNDSKPYKNSAHGFSRPTGVYLAFLSYKFMNQRLSELFHDWFNERKCSHYTYSTSHYDRDLETPFRRRGLRPSKVHLHFSWVQVPVLCIPSWSMYCNTILYKTCVVLLTSCDTSHNSQRSTTHWFLSTPTPSTSTYIISVRWHTYVIDIYALTYSTMCVLTPEIFFEVTLPIQASWCKCKIAMKILVVKVSEVDRIIW